MRFKDTFLLLALVSIIATSPAAVPVPSQGGPRGPKTDHMLIHIHVSEQLENAAIEMGIVEINDWPLSKAWIDAWTLEPEKYTMRDYAEIGIFEIDINNQRWPTGVPGKIPMEGPVEDTDMWRAWQFRRALAHLMDKTYVETEVMKGYANLIETPVPLPALAGYTNYTDLEAKGYIYDYDPAEAAAILDAAGFEDTDDDGVRNDPRTGANLEPLIFYIRWDNSPGRREAGERLALDIGAIGVPVDARVVERTVCFKEVMVEHDYHLYTGYWSLDADADYIYALYHSDFYWHPGFCYNYGGFCSEEFDYWAEKIVGIQIEEEPLPWLEVKMAQEVIMKYVGVIPMWASKGVKVYETGWDGVVNYEGYGIDNRWSFFNMYKPGEDTINYGFRSNLEGIHVISGIIIEPGTVVNPKVSGLIFDSMIGRNPYNLAEDYGWLATYWLGSIPQYGNPYCLFTLRDDATFHDGTPMLPEDVKFSLEFVRDCGPGVQEVKVSRCAGNYPFVMDIALVDTNAEDPTLGDWDVKVYFNVNSSWAPHWAGYMPIINKDLWIVGNDVYGWGYRWPYGETLLTTDLAEGDTTIYVKSTNYFEIGDIVEIGVRTDRLETNKIQSVLDDTIQLDIPLVNPHPEWEVVKYSQSALGSTKLTEDAEADATVIQVGDMKNFAPGDPIVIDEGGLDEETNKVKRTYRQGGIEYIELEYPIVSTHWEDEEVKETAQSTYWTPEKVMEYHPWEHDANDNGVIDLTEDGTGPWIFVDADPLLDEYILLDANRDFYKTQTEISDYLAEAFHAVGDVNYDRAISVLDFGLIIRALATTPATGGTPGDWDAWNPAADLNKDDIVDISDFYVFSIRYGKVAG